ncbi:Bacitracin transport ATP-binding protein BcrA [uncultured bacterium]|nr:Bacitracin transport ATP-binding protein BcrA [uncultured bacterium]
MIKDAIIQVQNLSKKYKDVLAVNSLSFSVGYGDVFGFLGPNGAGKSTTIRMLLSLIFPTDGEVFLFGKSLKNNRNEVLNKVGAIVEKPDMYGYLSAYKNLEILGRISGCDVSRNRIMEMLELVNLAGRADSKVKTFSHGMKQRLGLAQSLLHNPELIILDEPTTGLDPQGMKEMRDIINTLSTEKNITIFLSSHILHEVELVANRMIIMNKGTAVVQGNVRELLSAANMKIRIESDNGEATLRVINEGSFSVKPPEPSGDTVIIYNTRDVIPEITRTLVEQGVKVFAVVPTRSLEEYFLTITEKV